MNHPLLTSRKEFQQLCRRIRSAGIVAFDTEFVSEHTYRPELCLLQLATNADCVAVDPFRVGPLDAWWEIMADDETTVVVHGGQAEIRFCLTEFGRRPRKLIDVQLAEGFCSGSYPVSYASLVQRVLGVRLPKGETRTDWRRRPLSQRQLRYALEDVRHLHPLWEKQQQILKKRNRLEWVEEETERLITRLENELSRDVWMKLSGLNGLSPRELAVVRELAQWREHEAARSNRPPRRVLRDDLLVELAVRQPRSKTELFHTRDMNRTSYRKIADDLLQCIETACSLPETEWPELPRRKSGRSRLDDRVLGQFLGLVLAHRCAEEHIARQIVATAEELRDFVQWHVGGQQEKPPRLATGWRAGICGNLLTDLLDGKLSVRVGDPHSNHPLLFEPVKSP